MALHPDLDNAKLEGWREELLQARRAAFYIDGTAKIRLDNSNTTHNPQKLLCFGSLEAVRLPGMRSSKFSNHDSSMQVSALGATRAIASSAEQHSGLTIRLSDDEIQLLGHWASDAAKRYYNQNRPRMLKLSRQFQMGTL